MKKRYKVLIGILVVFVVAAGAFFLYVSDYYHADIALEAMAQQAGYAQDERYTVLYADSPSTTGLIFYPGGKVEETAYLPLLKQLSQKGITCVLVRMPFRLAVLDMNAADLVFSQLPDIQSWYIGGHSLGGAMASSYASSHADQIQGVILLGAYIYGDVLPEKAITIYGSKDEVLDRSKITYTENVVVIEGGNHACFGNYGEQDGDGIADISREEQQKKTVEAICSFMDLEAQ